MRLPAKLSALLLALPLATACATTQTVSVPMTLAPTVLIQGHPGVAVLPTELYDAADERAQRAGRMIESRVRAALSHELNSFVLIDQAKTSQVLDIIKGAGDRWDNLSSATMEAIESSFGNEIAPTAFFYARLIDAKPTSDIGQTSTLGLNEDGKVIPKIVNERTGEIVVRIGFTYVDGRTSKAVSDDFVGRAPAEATQSNDVNTEPPPLNYEPAFELALEQVALQFEKKYAFSTRPQLVPVFVGDGSFHFFLFEDKEYPLLKTGIERMKNGQFDKAEVAYQKQVEELENGSSEMLARASYNLAVAIAAQGRLKEALELYIKAEDLSTDAVIAAGRKRCEERLRTQTLIDGASAPPEA